MTITAIEFVFLASGNMTDYSVGPSHWIKKKRQHYENFDKLRLEGSVYLGRGVSGVSQFS